MLPISTGFLCDETTICETVGCGISTDYGTRSMDSHDMLVLPSLVFCRYPDCSFARSLSILINTPDDDLSWKSLYSIKNRKKQIFN